MKHYGVQVYRYGVVVHSDRRWRRRWFDGEERVVPAWMFTAARPSAWNRGGPPGFDPKAGTRRHRRGRGAMRAYSLASAKGLAFVAANAATEFRSLFTLTYHAAGDEWRSEEARNLDDFA